MLVRSAERAPYSAPQTASASADISVLMNVVSICRSRSGLAWASCSDRKWAGSILLSAVIALVSWIAVRGVPEDHAVAALTSGPHPERGPSYTTLADATRAILVVDPSHVQLPCSTHWESGSERMDRRRLLCHSPYRAGTGKAELNGPGHVMGRGSGLRCVT